MANEFTVMANRFPGEVGITGVRGTPTPTRVQVPAVQQSESVLGSAKAAQQELTTAGVSAGAEEPKPQELAANVEKLNALAQVMRRELRFSVHKETERVVIEVIDKDTDEVIRTIPPQEALALIEHLQDSTLMVNEEA